MYKVLINSLPKSGTNLLQKTVEYLGYKYAKKSLSSANILENFYLLRLLIRGGIFRKDKVIVGLDVKVTMSPRWIEKRLKSISNGEYISGHLNYSDHIYFLLRKNKYKIIHIIRDPRDVLISHISYAKKNKKHLFHKLYKDLSLEESIKLTLSGGYFNGLFLNSFYSILQDTYGWLLKSEKDKDILIVRFEDLVGELGGGSKERQRETLSKLIKFLDIPKDNLDLEDFNNAVYGKSHTFRKGKINTWKEELTKEQIKLIENSVGDFIIKFGYNLS